MPGPQQTTASVADDTREYREPPDRAPTAHARTRPQVAAATANRDAPNDIGDLVLKPRHAPRRNGYAERIVKRNPGTRVPVYLDMYDAATIVKIDDLVHQYMVDSKNFTSAAMPRRNGFPKA